MGITGNLQTIGLPDVLQLLSSGAKTGTLILSRCDDIIKLYFQDGKILYAVSEKKRESLLNLLVRNHDIELDQAEKIQAQARASKQSIEKTLLNSDIVSREILMNAAMLQAKETVYDLFQWMEGDFEFLDGTLPEGDELSLTLSLATFNLIMEGSRRIDEWSRIRKVIPSMDLIFRLEGDPTSGAIQFTKDEWQVLSLLDGLRNVRTICQMTSKSEFEVCRILYGLKSANFIQVSAQAPGAQITRIKPKSRYTPIALAGASLVLLTLAILIGILIGNRSSTPEQVVVSATITPQLTSIPALGIQITSTSPNAPISTPQPATQQEVPAESVPGTISTGNGGVATDASSSETSSRELSAPPSETLDETTSVESEARQEPTMEAVIEPTLVPAVAGGRIDINTASLEELMTLPKVGPSTAQNIIDYRETNGPFKSPQDLKSVPRIGDKTFDGLKDMIRCGSVTSDKTAFGSSNVEKPETSKKSSSSKAAKKTEPDSGSVININRAGVDALCELPGIGPALAQRIIDYRTEHGPFKDISEINDVKGIGDKLYARIEGRITIK